MRPLYTMAILSLILGACTGKGRGDPACRGYTGPWEGIPLCTAETIGDTCDPTGTRCEPEDDPNGFCTRTSNPPRITDGSSAGSTGV
jgi:hypothetical protein